MKNRRRGGVPSVTQKPTKVRFTPSNNEQYIDSFKPVEVKKGNLATVVEEKKANHNPILQSIQDGGIESTFMRKLE